jgi:hypothetical protein
METPKLRLCGDMNLWDSGRLAAALTSIENLPNKQSNYSQSLLSVVSISCSTDETLVGLSTGSLPQVVGGYESGWPIF